MDTINQTIINQTEITEYFKIISPKDLWTILIVGEGNGNYQFLTHIKEFRSYDCFVLAPDEMLAFVPEYHTSCHIISLTLSMEGIVKDKSDHSAYLMTEHFLNSGRPLTAFTLESESLLTIKNYTYILYNIQNCDLPYSILIRQYVVSALLIYLTRTYNIQKPQEKQASKELSSRVLLIEKVKYYINLNYSEDLSLPRIADYVFTNPSYLSRIFKETTGIGLFTYINQVRIAKARQLLVDTDDLIIDIAVACGFNYIPHFNNVFKGLEGMTPTQFRKKNKQKHAY